jgi:hypothetical protein
LAPPQGSVPLLLEISERPEHSGKSHVLSKMFLPCTDLLSFLFLFSLKKLLCIRMTDPEEKYPFDGWE